MTVTQLFRWGLAFSSATTAVLHREDRPAARSECVLPHIYTFICSHTREKCWFAQENTFSNFLILSFCIFLTGLWIWQARCFWVEFLTCLRTSRLLQENLLAAWKTCILITDQWTWQDSLLIMALYLVRVIVYSVMIVASCICDRLWWFQHTLPFKSLEVWKKLIKNH